MTVVHKLPGIGLLGFVPGDQIRQLPPLIVLVQLTIRKYKILNPHLSFHPIHARMKSNIFHWYYSTVRGGEHMEI